jgi:toxin FitB
LTGYLIDTNVISEVRKKKPHAGVLAWLESLALGQGFFSAVTFGESRVQKGIEITRRLDPAKANEIEVWAGNLERASYTRPSSRSIPYCNRFGGEYRHLGDAGFVPLIKVV